MESEANCKHEKKEGKQRTRLISSSEKESCQQKPGNVAKEQGKNEARRSHQLSFCVLVTTSGTTAQGKENISKLVVAYIFYNLRGHTSRD